MTSLASSLYVEDKLTSSPPSSAAVALSQFYLGSLFLTRLLRVLLLFASSKFRFFAFTPFCVSVFSSLGPSSAPSSLSFHLRTSSSSMKRHKPEPRRLPPPPLWSHRTVIHSLYNIVFMRTIPPSLAGTWVRGIGRGMGVGWT